VAGSICPVPLATPDAPTFSRPECSCAEKIAPKIATPKAPPIERVNVEVLEATPMSRCSTLF